MSKSLVTDELCALVEPLLPTEPPRPKCGRPRIPDRAVLTGIIFVLNGGIPWELPQEMGYGPGVTCWRRLRDWQAAGVWDRLHRLLLGRLGEAECIDWIRACLGSAAVPAKRAPQVGPNLTDRGKGGSKRHVMTERHGIPLVILLSAATRYDPIFFENLLDGVSTIRTAAGGRRKRPAKVHADKAYDIPRRRQALRRVGSPTG